MDSGENGNCAAVCIGFAFRSNNGCRSLPKEEKGRERDKTEVAAIIMIFPFVSTVCAPREGCLKKRRRRRKTVERNNESLCVTRTRRFFSSFFSRTKKERKGERKIKSNAKITRR